MVKGLNYRFRIRSSNLLGWSDFSNSLMVGLGPKPDKPSPPYKSTD